MNENILTELANVLEKRKQSGSDSSYVASLYNEGLDAILKKIGEEATEVVMSAKDTSNSDDKMKLVHEMADLWFHTLVLLAYENLGPDDVLKELDRRFGVSGHVEKASR